MTVPSTPSRPRPTGVRSRLLVGALVLLALIATLLVPAAGAAHAIGATDRRTPAAVTPTAADVDAWLDGLVPGLIDAHEAAGGVVVSVVAGGKTLAVRGYGAADADHLTREATPLDAERHLVRIGSISKTFTGIAVLQLAEAGRLDLDADVRTYLDFSLDLPRGAVTLRHLLSHTAGFEERLAGLDSATAEGMRSLRDVVATDPPRQIFAPGATPAYSNYSNDLAGYVVERVTGAPFESYVETSILRPLGMSSTTVDQPLPDALAGRLATGFATRGGEPGSFEFIASRPAGAITSGAPDMARYMNALLGHGGDAAISPAMRAQIVGATPTDGVGPLAKAGYVSLSFHHQDVGGRTVLGHGGDTSLFHSQMSIVPEADLGIFVSMTGGAKADLRSEIEKAFLLRYVAPTPSWGPRPDGSADRARAVEGTWRFTRRSESTFLALLTPTVRVRAEANGDLEALGSTWREVEPWVWQDGSGRHGIAARVGQDGTVEALAPDGYFSATPGGLLDKTQELIVLGAAMGVLLIALVTSLVLGLRRWRTRRRDESSTRSTGSSAQSGTRLRRIAAWTPVAALVACASVVVLLWPLIQGDLATPLPIPALWVAQAAFVLTGVGALLGLAHVVLLVRARRLLPALGALLVAVSAVVVVVIATTNGLLLPDATY
ncbi:serine hydrolase domain-containing protein [Mobilicoccus caccae]|uniref:Beta-lactamase-related domain-containing protein n=1 Tax=Mobilicoccus caccae TaxID=1859295 RepID=A0ABQ6INZ0_9MICO|nr:serine hydrolase domain-containing protein [Mobilicoccus caccae]GMA39156.1 hypothetical protein GCM10025883_12010 [Mobilicoccus caccae]